MVFDDFLPNHLKTARMAATRFHLAPFGRPGAFEEECSTAGGDLE
jgi:hypothetical protein